MKSYQHDCSKHELKIDNTNKLVKLDREVLEALTIHKEPSETKKSWGKERWSSPLLPMRTMSVCLYVSLVMLQH